MEKPIVKIENVSHRYSVQWAIRDINFEIPTRGIYGLLGSNGAGKSTLMNILCGVLRQTEGDIFIKGINTKENSVAAKRLIGFLPQKPPLHMDLTIEEFLYHCAGIRLMPDSEIPGAVENALTECGLLHFRNRLIRNLSGGYQQRVGIAQAIIHSPELIVFDEPTNGLDPNQIVEVRKLIKEIAEERAVMLSTHILSEVQVTCERVMMIEKGHLFFSGTMEDFDNQIVPDTLVVMMEQAPSEQELLAIPGITRVIAVTAKKYRMFFDEDQQLVAQRFIETSVAKGWGLTEIAIERSSLDAIFAKLSGKEILG